MAHNRSRCDVCDRGPLVGNTVSHAHNKHRTRQKPNVHRKKVKLSNGTVKRVHICTRCLRSDAISTLR